MCSILSLASFRYGARGGRNKLGNALFAAVIALFSLGLGHDTQAQTLRITALGDSLTQGYGLPSEDGLVPQLQAWLVARGHDVRVINAGVSGDTTAGGVSRLDWTLADAPDGLIVALGGNDLLRGIDPAVSRANLSAILARLAQDGVPAVLMGMPAPANYGPDYQAEFAAIFPDLAAEYGVGLVPDMLEPIGAQLANEAWPEELMQSDMIHPNRDGVALVVAGMGPAVEALIEQIRVGAGS